jgi:hypothetical protein
MNSDSPGGYTYNPIVNPIPNYMQNPYIMRQKQMALNVRNSSRGSEEANVPPKVESKDEN